MTMATITRANVASMRKLDVRPWNVRKGDVIRLDAGLPVAPQWTYATVTTVVKTRGPVSGERCWEIHTDFYDGNDSYVRSHFVREYATNYGVPNRVTVWRTKSYHVKRVRIADTSVAHLQFGTPSKVGTVRFSKTFRSERAAQREADAWAYSGPYAKHGPSDWTAEVLPGPTPRA